MTFDYKSMLKRYIYHVGDMEGTTFLSNSRLTWLFTNDEWKELQRLDAEGIYEARDGEGGPS